MTAWHRAVVPIVCFAVPVLGVGGCFSCGKFRRTSPPPQLVTLVHSGDGSAPERTPSGAPPHRTYAVSEVSTALREVLAGASPRDPLIVYVHGRGDGAESEPGKSLREIVPQLEDARDGVSARVLMFLWPGSDAGGLSGFPSSEAKCAGPEFGSFLEALNSSKGSLGDRPMVLVVHSLASFVLEGLPWARDDAPSKCPSGVFDNAVICSSASRTNTHAAWLAQLPLARHTYVTVNENDPILKAASFLASISWYSDCLGQKLDTWLSGNVQLAPGVEYVDLGAADLTSLRYFLPDAQAAGPHVRTFFRQVLSGNAIDWSTFEGLQGIEHRKDATIVHLRE